MKTELIARLAAALQKDPAEAAAEVRSIQKEYQREWTAEFESARQAFVEEGNDPKDFVHTQDAEDMQFETLLADYARLKKDNDARIAAEQARNLTIRQEIIAKIRDLSQLSENVSIAIRKLQELQHQWKESGPVSPHKYKEVQAEYSRAVEDIYYNIKIYRDLQEHDLKKNLEHKTELIEKLRAVQQMENIKEAERLIKVYRNEWDEIGPVPNARWEELKHQYKTALDETYGRIKEHYAHLEEQKENNLKQKKEIITRARELSEGFDESRIAKWNEITDKLIALQAEWKTIGRTVEKENERVWTEFRGVCDSFFERKKAFFAGLNEKFGENRKFKSSLIEKAEALSTSTDWQKTGHELMRLQDEWKKHPAHGDKEEQRLFTRFRKACNAFFDARKKYYEDVDASYEKNLEAKEALLAQLNAFVLTEDMAANREQLKAFSREWNAAGLVPAKDKKRMNDAFYNRMDELYEQMHMDRNEKAMLQFRSKLDRLAASDNAYDLLRKEADHLRKVSDEITSRMRTYDNNLGFFKTSKGSSGFMKEIEEKIASEKSKVAELAAKRKMVSDELAKIRTSQRAEA